MKTLKVLKRQLCMWWRRHRYNRVRRRIIRRRHNTGQWPIDRTGATRCCGYFRHEFMACRVCHGIDPPPDCYCGGYGEYSKPAVFL